MLSFGESIEVEKARARLWRTLGPLPSRAGEVAARVTSRTETDGYILEHLELKLNGRESVPAYFALPSEGNAPWPAVLYHHAHGGQYEIGKRELIESREGMQLPPYAVELTRRGFAVMCIDAWNFGERHNRTESSLFKEMLLHGEVLWGMMMHDAVRALDYLVGREEVNASRIGTMGMSMGSTSAWWLAALDTRVGVCVDICCLTDYEALINDHGLDRHGLYYFVPGLLKEFTAGDINALIAPRPHLSLAGGLDPLTPVEGLMKIDAQLREVYAAQGAEEAWRLEVFHCAHEETPEMRSLAVEWLEKYL